MVGSSRHNGWTLPSIAINACLASVYRPLLVRQILAHQLIPLIIHRLQAAVYKRLQSDTYSVTLRKDLFDELTLLF